MPDFRRLWDNARGVVGKAWRQADARVYGTPRAAAVYGSLSQPELEAMKAEVVTQFGETAWNDFVKTVDGAGTRVNGRQ